MTVSDTPIEPGGGNTSADPGLPDADAHIVKADLAARIDDIVRQRDLTQAEAGRLLGLSEPEISRLLRGDIREYSLVWRDNLGESRASNGMDASHPLMFGGRKGWTLTGRRHQSAKGRRASSSQANRRVRDED